jgi:hypothetical protein
MTRMIAGTQQQRAHHLKERLMNPRIARGAMIARKLTCCIQRIDRGFFSKKIDKALLWLGSPH